MPYDVRARGDQYCLFKKGTDKLPGSAEQFCHATREKAEAQRTAINLREANVAKNEFEGAQLIQTGHVDFSDAAVAERALRGEYVRILPKETFYDHYGQQRVIDDGAIAEFEDNWRHRADRGIRRSRLAVDESHVGGAVGWYKDVVGRDDGLYSSFTWTMKGRQLLEEGAYAYFSPTLYWQIPDRKTGELVHNQIGGGALTNYPYLGEETALMSNRVVSEEGVDDMAGQDGNDVQQVDMDALSQGVVERLLARFTGGNEGDAPEGIDEDAIRAELETTLGVMRDERVAVEATYQQQITDLQGRVAAAELARRRESYRSTVLHRFNHLPGEQDELVDHIAWLNSADTTEDAAHATFFMTLLEQADTEFARQFESRGVRQDIAASGAGTFEQIDTRVKAYMSEHDGATYEDAAGAIFAANPELAAQHFERNGGA